MNALVVGYGSIGTRHCRLLAEQGCSVAVVSARDEASFPRFRDLASALAVHRPEYLVIANETDRHHGTLSALADAGFGGLVLVEKPLFDRPREIPGVDPSRVFVGYNLRFHPVIRRLRELLAGEEILSVQAYAGQYLPTWRPGRDYRSGYGAKRGSGGVLRDLSHELDYLNLILEGWRSMAALGGKFSPLEIDSDDLFALLMTTGRCPVVTLQINYLDRVGRRQLVINAASRTVEADLVKGIVVVDGKVEEFVSDRDLTYREMHRAILSGDRGAVCTLAEGIGVVGMIDAAERAVSEGTWVRK